MSGLLHKLQDRVHKHFEEHGHHEGSRPGPSGASSKPGQGTPPKSHNPDKAEGHPGSHFDCCPPFPIDRPDDPLPVVPQPGQHAPGPGKMPPKVKRRDYHERHFFYHPEGHRHKTMRDLGFSGVLDGKIVWGWGDTLMGDEHQANICAVDATSIGSIKAPMCSMDTKLIPGTPFVATFLPLNKDEQEHGGLAEWTLGCSNIIELSPGSNNGVVYYHKVHRPGGVNHFLGSGVATCRMGPGSVPEAQRPFDIMWGEDEPKWGDVGAGLDGRDGHIYIWGHGPDTHEDYSTRTYLMRCPHDKSLEINSYEYWNNAEKRWMYERIGTADGSPGKVQITKEMAHWDWFAFNQSRPFWSNYFNKWMFIHSTGWPVSPVICKTADKLEGPWEDHGEVATTLPDGIPDFGQNGWRYCINGHPWFDPSGKTVLATWTRDNVIWGVTIEWE